MGMTKNKTHDKLDRAFVYVGICRNRRKNGRGKIGTTEKTVNKRASCIRNQTDKDFIPKAYIEIYNTTKARIEWVESSMRMDLEEYYTHVGNDHFEYAMNNKNVGNAEFVERAINIAVEYCNQKRFSYKVVFLP